MAHIVKIGDENGGIFINLDKVLSIDYERSSESVCNVTITYEGEVNEELEWSEDQLEELTDAIALEELE